MRLCTPQLNSHSVQPFNNSVRIVPDEKPFRCYSLKSLCQARRYCDQRISRLNSPEYEVGLDARSAAQRRRLERGNDKLLIINIAVGILTCTNRLDRKSTRLNSSHLV